jgi:DNA-3-methyladenine glycosylase
MRKNILHQKFYSRPTLKVAQELLGCFLVRACRGKIWRAMITETEAYAGEDDLASHASRGRTSRTELMYGQPGHAYVYMIYGMYHCLNIVTEEKDFPAAVLIRGVELTEVRPHSSLAARSDLLNVGMDFRGRTASRHRKQTDPNLNGPGKLCKFLKIDRKFNGWDITKGEKLWIESRDSKIKLLKITKSRRIGVDYAKHCKEYLWRFSLSSRA